MFAKTDDIIETDDGYIFAESKLNGLFYLPKETGNAALLGEFESENSGKLGLFCDCVCVGEFVYFFPNNGKNIWKYNTKTKVLDSIVIENLSYIISGSSALRVITYNEEMIYLSQACTSVLLVVDIATDKVSRFDLIPQIDLDTYGYIWHTRVIHTNNNEIVLYNKYKGLFLICDSNTFRIKTSINVGGVEDFIMEGDDIFYINEEGTFSQLGIIFNKTRTIFCLKKGDYLFNHDSNSIDVFDTKKRQYIYSFIDGKSVDLGVKKRIRGRSVVHDNILLISDNKGNVWRGGKHIFENIHLENNAEVKIIIFKHFIGKTNTLAKENEEYSLNDYISIICDKESFLS